MRAWASAATVVAMLGALGCGGEEPERGDVQAMQPPGAEAATGSNQAPRIDSVRFEPAQPVSGEPVRARVDSSDPDGDPVSLGFAWSVNGELVRGAGEMLPSGRALRGDRIEVRVTASDGRAESAPERVSITVGNRPPRLKGLQIEPAGRISTGARIAVTPDAEDPDGDLVDYEYLWLVNGSRHDEEGPVLDTGELRRGDRVQVRVVASDGRDESDPIDSPEIEVTNAAPVIVSRPGGETLDHFRYAIRAEDPDGDRALRYRLVAGPEGMNLDGLSGVVEWTPSPQQQGRFAVEVVVDDQRGGLASQHFEVTIGDAPLPAAPAP